MKIKYLFFLAIISLLFAFNVHKLYVSICHVEYVKKQQTVQITVSIFIDDLELALNKQNKTKLNIATKTEKNNVDVYFQKYLQNHLKIKLNNNINNFNF
ncbi:DUF6702 family protein [Lutibacter sp.]|uniref:DUF6702 family protein n=1 Tax=Lutibacter sp. TaxID=1925666 RepID=UPI002732B12C|nr:DUF6702 family protein [Lutibacter sp.]MDP3312101.1 hypothetical protein [Lutibacter sp.]